MDLTMRELGTGDEECFTDLCCGLTRYNWAHRTDTGGLERALKARRERIAQRLMDAGPTQLFLLAFLGGLPVGYAIAELDPQATIPTAFIDELYVAETQRGHGVGKRLLHEATRWAKKNQAKRLRLQAFAWNDSARHFYEAQGFHLWAVCYELGLPE